MALLRKIQRRLRRILRPDELDLTGDRQIEWAFVAGHIPDEGSTVLDFGCGNTPLGLAAALKGHRVVALDLGPVQWAVASPAIEFLQADINRHDFKGQQFDVILNCSTVEHVGLAGRFGSTDDADGDLKAMARLRQLLRPAGQMLMTIPIGRDQVCRPLHRIYGAERFPKLIDGYEQKHAEYWVKRGNRNVWVPSEVTEANSVPGGPAFYALGLFVLTTK
jgi:2-polyprenyl-3-methyl-5-hydroxy-6-metoxy-1,4-benzoquinol methylase